MRLSKMLLVVNQPLKLFEELKRTFEAYCSRSNAMLGCGLGHERSDEVVSENVRPDFFPNQLRRLHRKISICKVCFTERKSDSAFPSGFRSSPIGLEKCIISEVSFSCQKRTG